MDKVIRNAHRILCLDEMEQSKHDLVILTSSNGNKKRSLYTLVKMR